MKKLHLFNLIITLGLGLLWTTAQTKEEGDLYRRNRVEEAQMKIVSLLITVDMGSKTVEAPDDYDGQDKDFQEINQKLQESSYGQASYTWEIYPPKGEDPLVVDGTWIENKIGLSEQIQLFSKARTAAKERWGDEVFDGARHIYGRVKGKDGSAYVGSKLAFGGAGGNKQWHELIHNLGFNHGSDNTTPITTGGGGSLNAPMRAYKGWITEKQGFFEITEPGTYTLYDLDHSEILPGKAFSAHIVRLSEGLTGTYDHRGVDLWIEYRPNSPGKSHESFEKGVRLINYGYMKESNASRTIDVNPSTDDKEALVIGETWTDTDTTVKGSDISGTGIRITPVRVNDTSPKSIDVKIEFTGPVTLAQPRSQQPGLKTILSIGSLEQGIRIDGRHSTPILKK